MAAVVVTVIPREGATPRELRVDDSREEDGKEIRGGASLIDTLKRQERRGELFKVDVRAQEPAKAPAKAVKAAKPAVDAPAE